MKATSAILLSDMANIDYKTLFEDAPMAYLAVNNEGKINNVNQAALSLFGYRYKKELVGLNATDLYAIGKIRGAKAQHVFDQYADGKNKVRLETEMIKKDGSLFWGGIHVNAIKDTQGNLITRRVAIIDISDRKKSEEKYRKLFQHSNGLLCTHDMDGIVLTVNEACCNALEYTEKELIGTSIGDLLADNTRQAFGLYIKDILANHRSEGVMKMVSRTGKILYWKYSNVTHEEDGKMTVIGSAIDITELISREKELKQAKQMAEDSLRIKDIFLSNMSHEIRTPLNSMLGFADLLSDTSLNKVQSDYTSIIRESTERLIAIVNDILDFSKIESGHIEFQKAAIHPDELIDSVITMMSSKALMYGNKVTAKCDKNLPKVIYGDPVRLTQILINLLNNAIKFTDQGKIEVGAKTISKKKGKAILQFYVKDTGIGIPIEKLESIFDRFTQVESDHARRYEGVGLGLSIVSKLVDLQGGKIRVRSQVDKGSTFLVELPFDTEGEDSRSNKLQKGIELDHVDLAGRKILLVDDNRMNRKLVMAYLADTEAHVDLAINGKIAVAMMVKKQYDVVLMDMQMPEMDGYTATKVIRNELEDKVPIVAMTAHALAGEREKCLAVGMNEYISKPFKREQLMGVLGMLLNAKGTTKKRKTKKAASGYQHISLTELERNTLGNKEVMEELVTIFLEDAPRELQRLQNAVAEKDYDLLRQIGHSLKSSYEMLGAKAAFRLLREIEHWAADKEPIHRIADNTRLLLNLHPKVIRELDGVMGKDGK